MQQFFIIEEQTYTTLYIDIHWIWKVNNMPVQSASEGLLRYLCHTPGMGVYCTSSKTVPLYKSHRSALSPKYLSSPRANEFAVAVKEGVLCLYRLVYKS